MQKIYKDIQDAINGIITFNELYIMIKELDILDIHFHIHKLILKSQKYLINNPPNFSQLLCYYTVKPDIITKNKIISFYTIQQKILLTYFILEDNDYESFPEFFLKDLNILLLQKYINNFKQKIFILLIKLLSVKEISLLIERCDDNILEFLINNIEPFIFQQILSNLWDTKWLSIIKNLNIPQHYIFELKKNFKNSTNYNPAYLLLISKLFDDNEDFFIKNFLQQKNQIKTTLCPFLCMNLINKIFLHFNYINIDNYDFSWINFNEKNEENIKNFLKQKSIKINKILSSYNPQVISKKYDFLKKNIKIYTAISNVISNEKIFLIKESNLNKLFQAGTISYFGKNQYT